MVGKTTDEVAVILGSENAQEELRKFNFRYLFKIDIYPLYEILDKTMDKTFKHSSDVAILTGIESQSTALLRRDGAIKGFKNCGLNIVATQTAEWDTAKGRSVTESIILKNPNIKAIFASNDNMGLGAMQALKDADMNNVIVVGFDATPDAATSILKGEMTATIAQFSYNMGAYGVKYALELANGGSIDPNIDTGTQLVTKENANDFK